MILQSQLQALLPQILQYNKKWQPENPYEQSTLEYSEQQVADQSNQTALINVAPEFAFTTSKSIDISLDFQQARGRKATLLICSDYELDNESYAVNYDSCVVRAPLLDGRFDNHVQVLNRHSTMLGVVWFAEPGSEPLYQEIPIAAG